MAPEQVQAIWVRVSLEVKVFCTHTKAPKPASPLDPIQCHPSSRYIFLVPIYDDKVRTCVKH